MKKLFFVLMVLSGCQIAQLNSDLGQSYTIKQGTHFAKVGAANTPRIGVPFFGRIDTFYGSFRFGDGSWYARPDSRLDWEDINKLGGVTVGSNPLKHSVRIGWLPDWRTTEDSIFRLYAFIHDDGAFDFTEFASAELNRPTDFVIVIESDHARVFIDSGTPQQQSIMMRGTFPVSRRVGLYNVPYFGGNLPAPQTMNIGFRIGRQRYF